MIPKDLTHCAKSLARSFQALILDLIHNVDVLEQLIDAKAASADDWAWQRQLRFYRSQNPDAKTNRSETPGGAVVRMAESEFEYSFEYQGNAPKLVYTPLSDKCYLTLTQGMHLGYGGNPYGPAGTGKTESVKALGQFLGRQVRWLRLAVPSGGRIYEIAARSKAATNEGHKEP